MLSRSVLFLLNILLFDYVEATFDPAKSSIRPWLDFDGTNLPKLGACHRASFISDFTAIALEDTACASICNDSVSLYYASSVMTRQQYNANLANCGIWLTMTAAYYNSTGFPAPHIVSPVNWDGFADSTLNFSVLDRAPATAYAISAFLARMYKTLQGSLSFDDGKTPMACSPVSMFPLDGTDTLYPSTQYAIEQHVRTLHACLDSICSTPTLDPDLAGIGVSPNTCYDRQIPIHRNVF